MSTHISISEAVKRSGLSVNGITRAINSNRFKAYRTLQGNRNVWRIEVASFTKYYKTCRRRYKKEASERAPMISRGYRYIYKPEHPRAHFDGYVAEHILVAEAKYGRAILPSEDVHHKDFDRLNNAPDNILVFTNRAEHRKHGHGELAKLMGKISRRPDLVELCLGVIEMSKEDLSVVTELLNKESTL